MIFMRLAFVSLIALIIPTMAESTNCDLLRELDIIDNLSSADDAVASALANLSNAVNSNILACNEMARRVSSANPNVSHYITHIFVDSNSICRRHIMDVLLAVSSDESAAELALLIPPDDLRENPDIVHRVFNDGDPAVVALLAAQIAWNNLYEYRDDIARAVLQKKWSDDAEIFSKKLGTIYPWGMLIGETLVLLHNGETDPQYTKALQRIDEWMLELCSKEQCDEIANALRTAIRDILHITPVPDQRK